MDIDYIVTKMGHITSNHSPQHKILKEYIMNIGSILHKQLNIVVWSKATCQHDIHIYKNIPLYPVCIPCDNTLSNYQLPKIIS